MTENIITGVISGVIIGAMMLAITLIFNFYVNSHLKFKHAKIIYRSVEKYHSKKIHFWYKDGILESHFNDVSTSIKDIRALNSSIDITALEKLYTLYFEYNTFMRMHETENKGEYYKELARKFNGGYLDKALSEIHWKY